MLIIHPINEFFSTIFPDVAVGDFDSLIQTLREYYTLRTASPMIRIENNSVFIEVDTTGALSNDTDYRRAVSLCEKGKYSQAKPILERLISANPTNSEYRRVLGQVLSEEGNQVSAVEHLIHSLRWDPNNGWALLMMGNISSKFNHDLATAMTYYDQALRANPNDYITLNNIGANLIQQDEYAKAKKYFDQALDLNPHYPNTHIALALIARAENNLESAFTYAIQAIKYSKNKDLLYNNARSLASDVAQKITAINSSFDTFTKYKHELEIKGGTEIEVIENPDIPTAAKLEFAEIYDRDKHRIHYKPTFTAVEHLLLHELVHLDFVIEARRENVNKLFVATGHHKAEFMKGIGFTVKKLQSMGVSEDSIAKYCTGLFTGLNTQIFNAPIDLYIEDFLYHTYPQLHAYQFLSQNRLIQEAIKAVTGKNVVEISPKGILSASKIFSMVYALQFKDLYGLDYIKDFEASMLEVKQARTFYDDFLSRKDCRKPGDEYDLVQEWADELKVNHTFELVFENEFRERRTNIDTILSSIEKDPFDLQSKDPHKERMMKKFMESEQSIGTNLSVVMFMVDALGYFKDMPRDEIEKIAYEIAFQGSHGYHPQKEDYRLRSIPGKLFSGYHILAYYYVSWSLALPHKVADLKMPFEKEYQMAVAMVSSDDLGMD